MQRLISAATAILLVLATLFFASIAIGDPVALAPRANTPRTTAPPTR